MREVGVVRLADHIMSGHRITLPGYVLSEPDLFDHFRKTIKCFPDAVKQATVVVADECADYWYNTGDDYVRWVDFPNILPAFDVMWCEFRSPMNSKFWGKRPRKATGIIVETKKVADFASMVRAMCGQCDKEAIERNWDMIDKMQRALADVMQEVNCDNGFVSRYTAFIHLNDGNIVYVGDAYFACSPAGRYLTHMEYPVPVAHSEELENSRKILTSCLQVPLLTHSFMHCKNVKVKSNDPPQALSKAFQRRHGRPLVRYHTLEIQPMKKVLETEGEIGHNGLKKALHICRGHFANYSEERPLFGKVTGRFWIPAHTRGSLSEGAVVKDYKVKASVSQV